MSDVPPNGDAAGDGARPPGPPPNAPPAFDDDALAAALEADIAPYTQPITIVPPAAPAAATPPAPPPPPPASEPAPPAPTYSPSYESDYEAPDVPDYAVPPAPLAPEYVVPPAPPAEAYEPPPAPDFTSPIELPVEDGVGEPGPSTLDAIQRLEDELRRRTIPEQEASGAPTVATPLLSGEPGAAPPPATPPPWEPALDHPAPGHVFPSPYQPFTNPVEVPDAAPPPAFEAPPVDLEPPAAPEPPDWLDAPPPSFAPPELIEPPSVASPAPVAPLPPTEGVAYVAPTVLPPLREVRLEDVQGLPPPIGQQPAPIPPYDPAAGPAPAAPAFGAPPLAPLPSAPAFIDSPAPADPLASPPSDVSPAAFGGPYATPVDAPGPAPYDPTGLGATEPPSLDENDDSIDAIDRIFADAPPTAVPPVGNEPFGTFADPFAAPPAAPPSEPIPTQRLTDGQPGLVGQKPENHPVFVIESAGVEPTALDLRAGRAARLFWLWFATNSSVLSIAIGAVLFSTGMSLRQAIVAALAGVALSFLPLGLGVLAGKWSGQPTMVVSRATFGHLGNILPAIVAVITRVFWGAVLLWVLAVSVARLLVFAGLDAGLGESVWTFVVLGVGLVLAALVAVFGYGFVARLQLILSILSGLLVAGLIALTYPQLDLDSALAIGDGSWVLVLGGAVIVFAFVGLAWVQSSSEVARYQRVASSGAQSMLWATIGATLPPFALIVWGAMLAASDPVLATGLASSPLPTIARLLPLWYPAPLLAAAGLGLLSSVVMTTYSGGFALQALGLRARRSATTLITALLIGMVAAGLVLLSADAFSIARDLATTLAVPVAAWAGIFAAEMMIRTRRFDTPSLLAPGGVYPQVRVANLIGFILFTALGFGLTSATFPGLTWQGFLFPLLGIAADDPLATTDVGVLVALILGIILPLATAIPAIRRQERDGLKAEHTGPIPRITGAIPRITGPAPTFDAPPRLEP
jgi:purine-cytosine permease-like protein